MRIAFVSNVVYPYVTGGAEKRIHEIATRLRNKGHSITIYSRHFWDGPTETIHKGITLRAVAPRAKLYTDDDGRRSISEAIDFAVRTICSLNKHLRRNEHDIVVASIFPYFPVFAAKLATVGTATPLVTTWHEVWGDYWDEYLNHLAPFGKLTEYMTARTPQYPIAVSEITANRLSKIGPDRDWIRSIPNGIDFEKICTTKPAKDSFDVLFAGRLISDKRVDILLNAFDRAAPPNTTLGIIGDGPERESLKAQAKTLDTREQITFLGFLNDYNDVLSHMRAAQVFASPSTREGFGITYAEAMAADCTVIGVNHPDSAAREVIGDAGFLSNPTVDALSKTLSAALSGDRPSTNPVERAQRYDWDAVADQAETAYQSAIDGSW